MYSRIYLRHQRNPKRPARIFGWAYWPISEDAAEYASSVRVGEAALVSLEMASHVVVALLDRTRSRASRVRDAGAVAAEPAEHEGLAFDCCCGLEREMSALRFQKEEVNEEERRWWCGWDVPFEISLSVRQRTPSLMLVEGIVMP
jgi:hypothetical protein